MNIHDIAAKAGVSIATVSRVLNNSKNVSEKTREQVKAVMKELEYTPNAFARGLGLDSMRMIGILCTDVSDLFFARAVSLVERTLRQNGYDTLLCCTGSELMEKKKYLKKTMQKRVDAVILIGSPFREEGDNSHLTDAAKQIPVIIINGWVDIHGVYCVLCDERQAIRKNVEALVQKGHTDILFVYDALTFSGRQKLAGYRDAVKALALTEHTLKVDKGISAAKDGVLKWISSKQPLSAVVTGEDLLAVGAQKALVQSGRSDTPIIGFNNSYYAECTTPALTSVDNRLEDLCTSAIKLLEDIMQGREAPRRTILSAALIERETFQR